MKNEFQFLMDAPSFSPPVRLSAPGKGLNNQIVAREKDSGPGGSGSKERRDRRDEAAARVCVLDPEPRVCNDIEKLLQTTGCEVLCISKFIGCSNPIREFDPDLLVVDVMMPSVSGAKLIGVLRKNLPQWPLVILHSDMEETRLARLARETEADDFLVKQKDLLSLLNRVNYHLSRKIKGL